MTGRVLAARSPSTDSSVGGVRHSTTSSPSARAACLDGVGGVVAADEEGGDTDALTEQRGGDGREEAGAVGRAGVGGDRAAVLDVGQAAAGRR